MDDDGRPLHPLQSVDDTAAQRALHCEQTTSCGGLAPAERAAQVHGLARHHGQVIAAWVHHVVRIIDAGHRALVRVDVRRRDVRVRSDVVAEGTDEAARDLPHIAG